MEHCLGYEHIAVRNDPTFGPVMVKKGLAVYPEDTLK